ncbi:MAG: VanZ family protein [Flavobacteriaceae bacterium]|nr:VanZ family protein [Flavobacteriaceae bacterium]
MLKHKYLLGAIFWTVLIAVLSFANPSSFPKVDIVYSPDKLAHLGVYFILTVLWFLYFKRSKNWQFTKATKSAILLAFLYGVLVELLQASLTEFRSADYFDVLANTLGIIFAVVFCKWFLMKKPKLN